MQKLTIARNANGWAKVQITYRFGPPETKGAECGWRAEFRRVQGSAEYLLRGRPEMSLYEVTVEREP